MRGVKLTSIQKVVQWTVCKEFEAESLEEALRLAEKDVSEDWEEYGDPETTYYLGAIDG